MRQTVMANLTGILLAGITLAVASGGVESHRSPVPAIQEQEAGAAVTDVPAALSVAGIPPMPPRPAGGGPAVPPARGGASRRPRVIQYTVQPEDTLWDLAMKHGTDVTTLIAVNGLRDGHVLQIGQELRILTIPGLLYTVQDGDSLTDIASRYDIEVSAIETANELQPGEALVPGRELILPGARPPYVWPLRGEITSAYGPRWGRTHQGVDIGGPYGAPVVATRAGKVVEAGWDEVYGYYVLIDHGDGVESLYAHHSSLLVAAGDLVTSGETVGLVGSTGYSTGPHLHFEVREDGHSRDPLEYLARTQ